MNRIGVMDSGVGGLYVLKELGKVLSGVEFHYWADDQFVPYGSKSYQEILDRCRFVTRQLVERGCSLIVVACNTATALAIDDLRKQFSIPFVGVEPFINCLNKVGNDRWSKLALLITPATAYSSRFQLLKQRLDPRQVITTMVMPDLASTIESVFYSGEVTPFLADLERQFEPLKNGGFRQLVLGCTHYPLIKKTIESHFNMECVVPEGAIARRVVDLWPSIGSCRDGQAEFHFYRGSVGAWKRVALSTLDSWPK